MTRIIGGSAGGRRIRTPTGATTRPSSERVREALFSTIEATVGTLAGLRFLDLYAGSGAVGLEAGSRGASAVTLVERDRRTAALVRDNAQALGMRVEVVVSSVSTALAQPPSAPYDLVFLDPPYSADLASVTADLAALLAHGWLARVGLVVVERATRGQELRWPPGLVAEGRRRYGETALWYARESGQGGPRRDRG